MPDTYGYPGPEGRAFWAVLAGTFAVIFVVYVTAPLWAGALH